MDKKQKDILFGKQQEILLFDFIKKFFLDDDLKMSNDYDTYDYYSDKTLIEMKSRNNNYATYPTTMIAQDKITNNIIIGKELFFLFNFVDGLYYIPYNEEKFKKYKIDVFGREDRIVKDIKKRYIYIPIEDLERIK